MAAMVARRGEGPKTEGRRCEPHRRHLSLTWKSRLPYRLIFDMETTRVEPMSIIEGRAIGELQGVGRWTITHEAGVTTARYDWKVETTRPWMNLRPDRPTLLSLEPGSSDGLGR